MQLGLAGPLAPVTSQPHARPWQASLAMKGPLIGCCLLLPSFLIAPALEPSVGQGRTLDKRATGQVARGFDVASSVLTAVWSRPELTDELCESRGGRPGRGA